MNYNYTLTVLTPTHIGDGDTYNKKEFYINEKINLINRVNLNKYVNELSESSQKKFFHNIKDENFILKNNMENIKEYKLYHSVDQTITAKDDTKRTTIESTLKDNNTKPYIPGSSIKGSIKTAIIYDYLEKENPQTKEQYEQICNYKEIEEIMKNIQITDSSTAKKIYTIQPKPLTLKNPDEKRSNDDDKKQGMYNAIECINKTSLNIQIKLNKTANIDYIKECLYYFNYDYIEHELEFYKKIGTNKQIIKKYNKLKEKNTKEAPLIRIGGSTGLLSTTITLHMKNNNINLYTKQFKDKDGKPVNKNFPKIRKITPNNQPFGWNRLKSL